MDPTDTVTETSVGKAYSDYTQFLISDGLRGARIGVARQLCGISDHVDKLMVVCLEAIRDCGAILIDPADIPNTHKYNNAEFEVMLYEFKAGLNSYLSGLGSGAQIHSLKELIEFNANHADLEMPFFGQEILIKAQAKGPLTSKGYTAALARCRRYSRAEGIDKVMQQHQLDAVIAPTGCPPWITDPVNGDHYYGGCTSPPAVAGYPHITVPAGFVHGLPVGLSFIGAAYAEPTLIRLAYAFEQATRLRKPPRFLETARL